MLVKIIGLVIGISVASLGIYYLVKEKNDPESKKIYTCITAAGGITAAIRSSCKGITDSFTLRVQNDTPFSHCEYLRRAVILSFTRHCN